MATTESVNWWNSPSGKDFQTQLKNEIGKDKVENKDFLLFIFDKTGIATSVAKKWMEGGNPSIVNIENILLHCPKCNTFKTQDIVESLRVWKMQHNPKVIAKINNKWVCANYKPVCGTEARSFQGLLGNVTCESPSAYATG